MNPISRVTAYHIPGAASPFSLVITRGSVVDFNYTPNATSSAIVNAANEGCLGGGGVDGAIGDAGGPNLFADRQALPMVDPGIRCKTGSAVLTGPNSYGSLHVNHVIHAVGPNYRAYNSPEEGDALLFSAYTSSLECAQDANLEAVAFSLLSAGVFRGSKSVEEVLKIGMEAIVKYDGYAELEEVHMCAFSQEEADTLVKVAKKMGLKGGASSKSCEIL